MVPRESFNGPLGRVPAVPRRVWSGTTLLALGRMWGSLCTLAILYMTARHLETAAFGRLTFYLAVFLLLDSLADLGTGHAAVQRTANDPDAVPGVLRATRRIRLATASAGVAIVAAGAFAAGESGAPWIVLASLYPLTHALELSTLVFKNRIAWSRPVLVRMAASTASLAFVGAFLAAGAREPALFLLAVAAGSTLGNFGLHLVALPHLPRGPGVPVALRPVLMAALPMGIAGLCQQTYFYVDNLFIRAIVGEAELGPYNVAVRVMSYGIMIAVYASLAALPWLTREHAAGRLAAATEHLVQPLVALAALGVGLLWPWCEELLALFGAEFAAAAGSLRFLLCAALAVYVGAGAMSAIVAAGRSRTLLWIAVLGLAVNLAGNAWLVPRQGARGAAVATLATEVTVALAGALVVAHVGGARRAAAVDPRSARRAWLWLAAPALFFLARWASGFLPLGGLAP